MGMPILLDTTSCGAQSMFYVGMECGIAKGVPSQNSIISRG